jgi:hypothetical protein
MLRWSPSKFIVGRPYVVLLPGPLGPNGGDGLIDDRGGEAALGYVPACLFGRRASSRLASALEASRGSSWTSRLKASAVTVRAIVGEDETSVRRGRVAGG